MAKRLKNHTIDQYLKVLSQKRPTPGGGSAAALTGASGAALLSMVANYSLGKSKSKAIERRIERTLDKSEEIRLRLLELVDLDADAYMKVVKARGLSLRERQAADKVATQVPLEVGRLCYKAVQLAPFLAEKGNKYLVADVEIAVELLSSAYHSALILQNHSS